jgi:hypothetical protein
VLSTSRLNCSRVEKIAGTEIMVLQPQFAGLDRRLRTGTDRVTRVLTLLCQGCPLQAMVAVEDAPVLTNQAVLTAGMYRVGCAYNFGGYHDSLRRAAPKNAPRKWQERTPAMAAGLADPC